MRKAGKPLLAGKPASLRSSYEGYREKLSVREAAYAAAKKAGLSIEEVCDRLGLTVAYIKDNRK